ncbi:PREDICTED: uncharacterized protein LOC104607074 isoform X1 [Nelumbo nucifera]|uniref:Uncharacterized protein LOC104607074 isoform X1 n=1 Tax=Nelumbo nucifera TaxID=4432 RepID=A0A1U8B457_NELNU|nr:PREDICTED: uncharacterized protein LOC104607074 isoform X1 [Nelumbo nucifera]XP_010270869.1 PREDICTED: uncharacterized protein LOC104607074 isoform X1 [Nelumbo nucifera]
MIYHRPHRPKTVELSRSLRSCGGLGAIRRYDRSKADWMDDDVEDEWVDYEELDDGFRSEDGSSSKSYVDTIQVCVDSGDDLQIVSLFDEKEDAVRKRSQGGEVFHSTTNRDGDLRLTPASGLKGLSSYQVGNRGIQRGSELIPCERQEQDDKLVGQQGIQEVTKDVLGGGISTVMAKSDTLSKPSQLVSTEAGDLERYQMDNALWNSCY